MSAIKEQREPSQTWRLARRHMEKHYLDMVPAERRGPRLRVLDVGSGPFSHQGCMLDGAQFELVCTDALADQYAALLDEFGIRVPVQTLKCHAEQLSTLFAPGSFDFVTSTNALDHTRDPVAAIGEMFKVCRSGGGVCIEVTQDEGEHENYFGFHQSNFRVEDGALIVWNRNGLRANIDTIYGNQIRSSRKMVDDHPWRQTEWGKDSRFLLAYYAKF